MAETYGFYDGGAEYGQLELLRYYNAMFRAGVFVADDGTLDYALSKGTNAVNVGKGFAIILGGWNNNDTTKSIAIPKPSNYNRIDRIVIRNDLSARKCVITRLAGTPASSPQPPALTRNDTVYDISLCQVLAGTNGSITITDERYNTNLCGAIRARGLTEVNEMIKDYQKQFETWFNSVQSKAWRNIYIQSSQPSSPEAGSIWI